VLAVFIFKMTLVLVGKNACFFWGLTFWLEKTFVFLGGGWPSSIEVIGESRDTCRWGSWWFQWFVGFFSARTNRGDNPNLISTYVCFYWVEKLPFLKKGGPDRSQRFVSTWLQVPVWVCVLLKYAYLAGGFKDFFIFNPTCENDPIWLMFFKWVETTT